MEGWGISIIEANACGTPVVASDVPGLRDSVDNPSSGYLVEYKNVEEFADKIKKLIVNDNLRYKFSKDSIEWAKKFSWDSSAEKFLSVINYAEEEYIANREKNPNFFIPKIEILYKTLNLQKTMDKETVYGEK
jgi:glycosyltransferase involved in cell wall biosynthesis